MISKIMPKCKECDRVVRPNVLLWNDSTFVFTEVDAGKERLKNFIWDCFYEDKKVAIIEIGAGHTY